MTGVSTSGKKFIGAAARPAQIAVAHLGLQPLRQNNVDGKERGIAQHQRANVPMAKLGGLWNSRRFTIG